ncbi:Vps51/Vps67 [Ancylostoma caninum]|uniref:Conserved oligomeric Golgi complex subunit 1 n=1 Tax=Ancylostoma caninum TaxID=29170 RepID=A0A368G839_ANCCA|nr:Vps51/Vps67 [Ancylostoma caninum]
MDVERLMKDLTVEQLQHIQGNLQTEMEGKKEELREMVGRRYRDVLEASSEVRNVRELAEKLAEAVSSARTTQSVVEPRPMSREQQASVQRFIALHRLIAMIGEPEGDALSDAFALTLAELLHKQLATEPLTTSMHSVVSGLTGRVIRTRRQLLTDLEDEIGELSEPDWVANQLTALALLQGTDYERLLDLYLEGRKNFIANLITESSSLLNVVNELKKTLIVVEQLFVQGELFRIIQAAGCPSYRPDLIDALIGDEAFSFGRMLTSEAEKVTRQLRESKASSLLPQKINVKCSEWIGRVCSFAREPVVSICDFYEKASDIIEFLHALSGILRTGIISHDLCELEKRLISQLKSINLEPSPLFEKTSKKFDALIGVGISPSLEGCISSFYAGVQSARDSCAKYEQVEMDSQPERVREALATELFAVVER